MTRLQRGWLQTSALLGIGAVFAFVFGPTFAYLLDVSASAGWWSAVTTLAVLMAGGYIATRKSVSSRPT